MSPAEVLAGLAAGDPACARRLLPACRARAFGAEAFGPAAVAALFARHVAPLTATPDVVEGSGLVAVFDADPAGAEQAWVADLHDGHVARLWRLGPGPGDEAVEPSLAFAADPFLTQRRDPVALRVADHPDLDPATAEALAQVADAAAAGPDPDAPAVAGRAFVLRAVSQKDRGAALLGVTGLEGAGGDGVRLAAIALRIEGGHLVHARTVWDAPRTCARRPHV